MKVWTIGFTYLVIAIFMVTFVTVSLFDGRTFVDDLVAHEHQTVLGSHTHPEFDACANLSEAIDEMYDKVQMLNEIDTLQADAIMGLYILLPPATLGIP